jgi:cyanate lyase
MGMFQIIMPYGDHEKMAIGHNSKNFVSVNSLSKTDKKRLKKVIQDLNDSLTRVSSEKEYQKEAIASVSEDLGLNKKLVKRMATVYYKSNFKDEIETQKEFEEFYEMVINTADEVEEV